mmetsp:Transcript_17321/g.23408  ORF Transcript_17321/g.23408 Transcript_17321/m.23408 type:complete len:209 (+) Transcript_17321:17-643(+)
MGGAHVVLGCNGPCSIHESGVRRADRDATFFRCLGEHNADEIHLEHVRLDEYTQPRQASREPVGFVVRSRAAVTEDGSRGAEVAESTDSAGRTKPRGGCHARHALQKGPAGDKDGSGTLDPMQWGQLAEALSLARKAAEADAEAQRELLRTTQLLACEDEEIGDEGHGFVGKKVSRRSKADLGPGREESFPLSVDNASVRRVMAPGPW